LSAPSKGAPGRKAGIIALGWYSPIELDITPTPVLPPANLTGWKLVDLNVAIADHRVIHVVESAETKIDFVR
jgi:hypothetical protein